jgi:hypothetical protein
VRYPEKDHAPEAALLKKTQTALSGELLRPGPVIVRIPRSKDAA